MKKINIDDLFSQKISEKNFEFQASSWDKFKEMKDLEDERKRRRGFFWLLGSGLLLIILVSGFLFQYDFGDTKKTSIALSHENKGSSKSLNTLNENLIESANNNSTSITDKKNVTDNSKKSNFASVIQQPKQKVFKELKPTNLSIAKTRNNLLSTYTSDSNNSTESKLSKALEKQIIKDEILPILSKMNKDNKSLLKIKSIKQIAVSDLLALRSLPRLELSKYKKKSSIKIRSPKYFKWLASIDLAHGTLSHVSGTIGIGGNLEFAKSWHLESGINYSFISAHRLPIHRETNMKYNLSTSNFYESTIEANEFHMLSIPFMIRKEINKHSVGIGMDYKYLFLVRGKITTDKEGSLQQRDVWIVERGLNQHRLNVNLSYGFAISPKLKIKGGIRYDISDIYSSPSLPRQKFNAIYTGLNYYF